MPNLESIQSLEANVQDPRALNLGEVCEQELSRVLQGSLKCAECHSLGHLVLSNNAPSRVVAIAAEVILQLE